MYSAFHNYPPPLDSEGEMGQACPTESGGGRISMQGADSEMRMVDGVQNLDSLNNIGHGATLE